MEGPGDRRSARACVASQAHDPNGKGKGKGDDPGQNATPGMPHAPARQVGGWEQVEVLTDLAAGVATQRGRGAVSQYRYVSSRGERSLANRSGHCHEVMTESTVVRKMKDARIALIARPDREGIR